MHQRKHILRPTCLSLIKRSRQLFAAVLALALCSLNYAPANAADASAAAPPKGIPYQFHYPMVKGTTDRFSSAPGRKVLVCYQLIAGASQDYYLTPASSEETGQPKCWDRQNSDDESALTARQRLWIGIYVPQDSATLAGAISSIYLNVTAQAASPIQVTPIRPSAALPAVKGPSTAVMYYFAWPYPLQGDTIPTVEVTAYADVNGDGKIDDPYKIGSDALPQVHQLSRFNLSTAVVYNTLKTQTFGYSSALSPTVTGSNHIIDPVLFLTYYPVPFDAERPWHWSDMIPGASLGFSLSNPTSNFYAGFSSEFPFIRNVQLTYGLSVAKTSELPDAKTLQPAVTATATSIPTPVTVSKYKLGGYVGLSFNVSGFLSALFSKGG